MSLGEASLGAGHTFKGNYGDCAHGQETAGQGQEFKGNYGGPEKGGSDIGQEECLQRSGIQRHTQTTIICLWSPILGAP